MSTLHFPVASYVIAIIGGCLLILGSFSIGFRNSPALLRTVLWSSGSLVIGWGVLGFVYWYGYYHLTPSARMRVDQIKTIFAGGSLALLILLITSGDFRKADNFLWLTRKRSASNSPETPAA